MTKFLQNFAIITIVFNIISSLALDESSLENTRISGSLRVLEENKIVCNSNSFSNSLITDSDLQKATQYRAKVREYVPENLLLNLLMSPQSNTYIIQYYERSLQQASNKFGNFIILCIALLAIFLIEYSCFKASNYYTFPIKYGFARRAKQRKCFHIIALVLVSAGVISSLVGINHTSKIVQNNQDSYCTKQIYFSKFQEGSPELGWIGLKHISNMIEQVNKDIEYFADALKPINIEIAHLQYLHEDVVNQADKLYMDFRSERIIRPDPMLGDDKTYVPSYLQVNKIISLS